jgi:hypothetical protein
MKYISRFLLAVVFYAAGICTAEACQDFDPGKSCKAADTTAAKKAPVKLTITAQPANKPAAKKEEKKDDGDFVSPLSWRPTFLY